MVDHKYIIHFNNGKQFFLKKQMGSTRFLIHAHRHTIREVSETLDGYVGDPVTVEEEGSYFERINPPEGIIALQEPLDPEAVEAFRIQWEKHMNNITAGPKIELLQPISDPYLTDKVAELLDDAFDNGGSGINWDKANDNIVQYIKTLIK